MNSSIIQAVNLGKEYPLPVGSFWVFRGLDFSLESGDLVAIMGASGVGKTTLLNLLGALDKPTEGGVLLEGEAMFSKTEKDLADIRNRKVGFVFQFYHLLPEFTTLENVSFPLLIRGMEKKAAFERAARVLEEVSLSEKAEMRPAQLSGGEQQRIAVARALVNEPRLLLADEPTGNLDWQTGVKILELVLELHRKRGLSSIIVTHNEKIARYCRKVYLMEGGKLKLLPAPPG